MGISHIRDLCRSMSSFGIKSLMTFDWFLKSRKHFLCCFLNCDQGARIKGIYSFAKKYYHKNCTPQIINFNKKFVSHYFSSCFAYIVGLLQNLCLHLYPPKLSWLVYFQYYLTFFLNNLSSLSWLIVGNTLPKLLKYGFTFILDQ